MAKRKNKDPGRTRQQHPQQSFQDMVANLVTSRMEGHISNEVARLSQDLRVQQANAQKNILMRLMALEELACERLNVTKDDLAERVAQVQDGAEGFEESPEGVVLGDRVRLEIKTRTKDQTEYQGSTRLLIDNAGAGGTLGAELEAAIIGMKAGETKEVPFGKDASMVASIKISKVSREEQQAAAPAAPTEAPAQEAPNADADAG
jgi:hypothetical protein